MSTVHWMVVFFECVSLLRGIARFCLVRAIKLQWATYRSGGDGGRQPTLQKVGVQYWFCVWSIGCPLPDVPVGGLSRVFCLVAAFVSS